MFEVFVGIISARVIPFSVIERPEAVVVAKNEFPETIKSPLTKVFASVDVPETFNDPKIFSSPEIV